MNMLLTPSARTTGVSCPARGTDSGSRTRTHCWSRTSGMAHTAAQRTPRRDPTCEERERSKRGLPARRSNPGGATRHHPQARNPRNASPLHALPVRTWTAVTNQGDRTRPNQAWKTSKIAALWGARTQRQIQLSSAPRACFRGASYASMWRASQLKGAHSTLRVARLVEQPKATAGLTTLCPHLRKGQHVLCLLEGDCPALGQHRQHGQIQHIRPAQPERK
jgi:hypothetical protein